MALSRCFGWGGAPPCRCSGGAEAAGRPAPPIFLWAGQPKPSPRVNGRKNVPRSMTESEGVVTDLSMRAVLDGKPLRPSRRMYLRPLTIVAHQAVIAYVCLGWTVQSRVGLFLYLLFLPLVALQWLVNHATSNITNLW